MRQTVRLPSLANVAAGGTATLNMPLGRTYEKLILSYSGVTRAQLKDLKLLIDGKPILEYETAEQLASINKYYGRHDAAGYITIWFVRPEMNALEQQRVTGLGTGLNGKGVIQTLQLEVDIDAAAENPVIDARAVQSDPKPLGVMTKVKRFVYSSATSGQFEIDNIPKGPRLAAVHFIKSAGDITRIEVEQNSRKIVEGDKGLLQYLQSESGRTPQPQFLAVDWLQEGDLGQTIVTNPNVIQDQRFRLTLATPGAVTVLVEYLDGYDGI
ncbi:major capsid protein P2 [Chromohalobacter israelensis]|uniref:major capsid protein P2 n=1 Tax=Chromohalobacter israelensis TaxID=141390 RepID=UPI00265C16EB|nr:major capsid protein P2 [Chromohalobacter salexigens]MDO0946638.1 major capsid protein P2 [Chromohalobacter salexigens]